ncbi:putative type-1 restriction enzyme specificity protein [Haemophilus influenzae]|uniref:restriction endonuclease subunit S n=1 Tax=Haemophilus influenzae TaxID=727 RepID=UPI000D006F8E|nr:restriction endonuclease subunit S [Haemophilus influenzae]MBG0849636.1 restriction endonuclease subunit S [Haemophilus influenzae]MCK9063598.1 restriction endonuclease subunit S [Haemophilus influenzae]PRI41535.1 putative type-1 restriction enzyme specificity protein [Haemophilus influenzae]PRM51860.1 putative type-1 restriction enzyme specificity protein [Haemophilus influenzae]
MKNNRTFLEKLLDGAEVEWKPLKKVCNFISTGKLNANAMDENGIYPFFTCNEKPYKINNYAFDMEAILISGNGSQVGHLNYFKGKFNAYQRTYVIGEFDNNTLVMYLYHYLNFKLRDYITINSKKGSVPYITLPMLEKFEIPIPPLSVQIEIVKILDALTALTSELTSELILRQKQYEYYREKLLSEEELGKVGFEWKTLGDVAKIQRGASPRPISQYITDDPNGIPWIKIGDTSLDSKYIENTAQKITIEGAEKSRILKSGDFVMSNSMSYGRPYILKISGAIHDGWASISNFGNILNSDFLYYYLSSNTVQSYWNGKINSSSVSNLNSDIIKSLSIPIPTLNIQIEIAKTLDKFETLTNSITKGLPLAIEQSQKRYEYYRELLLNFPGRE